MREFSTQQYEIHRRWRQNQLPRFFLISNFRWNIDAWRQYRLVGRGTDLESVSRRTCGVASRCWVTQKAVLNMLGWPAIYPIGFISAEVGYHYESSNRSSALSNALNIITLHHRISAMLNEIDRWERYISIIIAGFCHPKIASQITYNQLRPIIPSTWTVCHDAATLTLPLLHELKSKKKRWPEWTKRTGTSTLLVSVWHQRKKCKQQWQTIIDKHAISLNLFAFVNVSSWTSPIHVCIYPLQNSESVHSMTDRQQQNEQSTRKKKKKQKRNRHTDGGQPCS